MSIDVVYTNGIIAAREKDFLSDKLSALAEGSFESALRTIQESGFGGNTECENVYDYEKLIAFEEEKTDTFIRENAPSERLKEYFLIGRDFHNAKALFKASKLSISPDKMLAPYGTISISVMKECFDKGDYSKLYPTLKNAIEKADSFFVEDKGIDGASIGAIFENAKFAAILDTCKHDRVLLGLLKRKIDMTNILSASRSYNAEVFKENFLLGGKLSVSQFSDVFSSDLDKVEKAFSSTPYSAFYKMCLEEKNLGYPPREAEKELDSFDLDFFGDRKYDLKNREPFLYYVFRRRAECQNVRILLSGLLSNRSDKEIRKRFRGV